MRFAIPFGQNSGSRMGRYVTDWPLSLRFALLVLPVGVCIALLASWVGYRAASGALHEALESVPLMQAKTQAHYMGRTLEQFRTGLAHIAQADAINAQTLRETMAQYFQDNLPLVHEIGYNPKDGEGFILLRDQNEFTVLSTQEAGAGAYSPFQQAASVPVAPGTAAVLPIVYFDDPAGNPERKDRTPVMRIIYALPDGSGLLALGISLADWERRLSVFVGPGSPLRMSRQEGAAQLAFFFDQRGWILFEMDSAGKSSFLPDVAREGYSGDLGRPGFDAAFRPWAIHENYWRMVTEAAAGRSGSVPAPADKYMAAGAGSTGFLCYSPVLFTPKDGAPPQYIGGIAFFETSMLPLGAFLRFANYTLGTALAAACMFALLSWRVDRKIGRPLKRMADTLGAMAEEGELAFVDQGPACEEQQKLQAAVNTIIAGALNTTNELRRLEKEVRHTRSRQPVELVGAVIGTVREAEFGLVGSSALMRGVRDHVRKAARAGTDVLIWGETGTGKELVAAAIHKASAKNQGPYVSINCGALDENLLLDALFGHVKGAFSEAKNDRKGAFLAAEGGTLHLDEIANASPKVQQALLRALSVRRIRPLGTDEEVPFATRVVAATNVDLRECVRAGAFREDLYYRLAIISIETPPLRLRKEDIPELAAHCLHESALAMGRPEPKLSRGAMDIMAGHDWPGNVRELKNCLTRAMAFADGDLIMPQHIVLKRGRQAEQGEDLPAPGEMDALPETGALATFSSPPHIPPAQTAAPRAEATAPPSLAGLNERQERAVRLLREQGGFSRAEYEAVAGGELSSRTAQNDLRELVERGILRRVGAGPGTRYVPGEAARDC